MKPETILKKAIEKAVKDGWDIGGKWKVRNIGQLTVYIEMDDTEGGWGIELCLAQIIFSPDFAKAFWGIKVVCSICGEARNCKYWCEESRVKKEVWQYHQHKMLDEIQAGKDPILYLKKFL